MTGIEWMKSLKLDELYDLIDGIIQEKDKRVEAMIMRTFPTGATRDSDENKLDYEGFLSPLALKRYAEYMHKHRKQADGALRASDNWQKGIPREQYMKSAWRHMMDWWREHRGVDRDPGNMVDEETICALIFNAMGYLHEVMASRLEMNKTLHAGPIEYRVGSLLRISPAYVDGYCDGSSGRPMAQIGHAEYNAGYINGKKDAALEKQV